jgi:hypothetical protein
MIQPSVTLKRRNFYKFETLPLAPSKLKAQCHQAVHKQLKAQKRTLTLRFLQARPLQGLKFFQQEVRQSSTTQQQNNKTLHKIHHKKQE